MKNLRLTHICSLPVVAFGLLLLAAVCGFQPLPRDMPATVPGSSVAAALPFQQRSFAFEADLRASYALAKEWFRHSMRDKGLFRYNFLPGPNNKYSSRNNAIRQLMASRLLAEMCHEDSSLLPLHQKNLDFLMKYWYKEKVNEAGETEAYIFYNHKSKLGANAMMLRTLAVSPLLNDYLLEARYLLNGIRACINDDGSMVPWYDMPPYESDFDYLLTFYSGEAIVALVEYGQRVADQAVIELAIKCQDHYIEKYVQQMEENYYPAYVPWHSISLNKLYHLTGDRKYAHAIFTMNDKLLEIQDTTQFVGRFYNPETPQYGSPHTSSDGVYTEGLAYALEMALLLNDQARASRYERAITLSIKNLRSLQYLPEACRDFEYPERAIGGFRTSITSYWCRIDCGQHILDAYRKLLRLIGDADIRP